MKTKFNKKHLTLAILSVLLSAANGNAADSRVSVRPAVRPGPKAATTQLVSVNLAGTATGNSSSSGSVLSADGRFVGFSSSASDLVANDTNDKADAFVRDLKTGTTTLVSVNSEGTASANGNSGVSAISADGRFVAFGSNASDLVAENDTNNKQDIFVRDLKTETTTLASVNSAGTASGENFSSGAKLSADGRFVAFYSFANDLVVNDTNANGEGSVDAFVRDLKTGTTTLATVNLAGTTSDNGPLFSFVLSANGRFVAFASGASDLVANDTNGEFDVFVRDLKTGITTLASVNNAGTASGNDLFSAPVLSANGRFVAFSSGANDLVANDTNDRLDVFVRDLKTGTTTLVSVNLAGTASGTGGSHGQVLSADGRIVAFIGTAIDLVANDTNGTGDIFVRDLKTGTTTLATVNSAGGGRPTGINSFGSLNPVLSAHGRFVAFNTDQDDLVSTDTNGTADVFVRDLKIGKTTLASVNLTGTASGNSGEVIFSYPALSANGRFVAYTSEASDLVANDTNGATDVFVRPTR